MSHIVYVGWVGSHGPGGVVPDIHPQKLHVHLQRQLGVLGRNHSLPLIAIPTLEGAAHRLESGAVHQEEDVYPANVFESLSSMVGRFPQAYGSSHVSREQISSVRIKKVLTLPDVAGLLRPSDRSHLHQAVIVVYIACVLPN